MKTFTVKDMRCEHCAARIEKAFAEEGIPCEVRLEGKTVTVADEHVQAAASLLDDLGFTAE